MQKHLKDYFIPHEGNGYTPHSLQKAAMVGMVCMVLLSFALTNVQSMLWTSSQWLISSVLPAVIVELTNEEREENALADLRRSSVLDAAAQLKAQDMAENEYFAHFSPTGVSPWHWFGQVSYNFVHAGENLAVHFTDSSDVVQAWMESPTHRANIVNGNYTEIGVGTAEGEYEGYKTVYVVQLFGTPAAGATVAGETAPEEATTEVASTEEIAIAQSEEDTVLSESVAVSEEVEIIPSEPVAVTQQTEVADVAVTEDSVVLYSDFVSTSTGGVPASIDPEKEEKIQDAPYLLEIATQPHVVLQLLYVAIGLFVLGSLLLSILIEIRRQQPIQIAYGTALLVLMYGLFQLHMLTSGGVLIA